MVNILDLFDEVELERYEERYDGTLKGPCPSCGSNNGNYGNCIINPKTNTLHCFSSGTNFDFLECVALIKGIITCREGRQ